MPGALITTTHLEGFRPLGLHGQPVVEAYGQIARYLRTAMSPAHAALLAEPNAGVRPGVVEWYAIVDGEVRKPDALSPEERAIFDAALKRQVDQITARATQLKQSKESGEQLLGELLELSLRVPSTDHIYAVGSQPVLVAWGSVVDAPGADETVLQRRVAAPARPPGPPPVPVPVLADQAARRTMWPWWLALLVLLVLVGFLLPWFAAPLLAALVRPDSGFCAIPPEQRRMVASFDTEQSEEASLRRELTFVEAIIAERAAQCHAPTQTARNDPRVPVRRPDPLPDRPVPDRPIPDRPQVDVPVVPGTGGHGIDTPGVDVPRPDIATPDRPDVPDRTDVTRTDPPRPDQRPDQRTDPPRTDQRNDQTRTDPPRPDQRTNPPRPDQRPDQRPTTNPPRPDQRQQASTPRPEDVRQRLDREHVQDQEVSVALAWNTQDDLDVVVMCPNNQQVSYRNAQGCGGQLDVDMNRSEPRSDTPVESVSFPRADAAPRGRYRVQIDNQSNETVPYRVRVTVRGESREYTGTVAPHVHGHRVTEFDLPTGRAAQ